MVADAVGVLAAATTALKTERGPHALGLNFEFEQHRLDDNLFITSLVVLCN